MTEYDGAARNAVAGDISFVIEHYDRISKQWAASVLQTIVYFLILKVNETKGTIKRI